jgi:CheY-specific phosphatase CheX
LRIIEPIPFCVEKTGRSCALLNADQVNAILESFYQELENRLPAWKPLSLGNPEALSGGASGAFILSALFSGEQEGKLTLIYDWDTVFRVAGELLQTPVDTLDEQTQTALWNVFHACLQSIAVRFTEQGLSVNISPLPILSDACALLAEDHHTPVLKLPLQTRGGTLQLYLAFR